MIFHYIRIGISEIIHLPRVSKVATLVKMVLSIPKTRFKTKMSLSTFVKVSRFAPRLHIYNLYSSPGAKSLFLSWPLQKYWVSFYFSNLVYGPWLSFSEGLPLQYPWANALYRYRSYLTTKMHPSLGCYQRRHERKSTSVTRRSLQYLHFIHNTAQLHWKAYLKSYFKSLLSHPSQSIKAATKV